MSDWRVLLSVVLLGAGGCGEHEVLDVDRYCDALVSCMIEQYGEMQAQTKEECLEITARIRDDGEDAGCGEETDAVLICMIEPFEECSDPIDLSECTDDVNEHSDCLSPGSEE